MLRNKNLYMFTASADPLPGCVCSSQEKGTKFSIFSYVRTEVKAHNCNSLKTPERHSIPNSEPVLSSGAACTSMFF